MTHEPGRERFISYCCEKCSRRQREELIYVGHADEMWCESCVDNAAEAAWQRHQEDLMENGPGPSLQDICNEARKLK
jgi:hypothetical protein